MSIFKAENLAQADVKAALPEPRHTVMVVDDVRANASVMAAILRPHFHLIEAHDGEEAMALIDALPAAQELACVISDHRMPRMSGVQLFERLRRTLPQTRRVLVTGYMDMDAVVDAINRAEVYRFVAKPFDAADFLLTARCAVAAFDAARAQAAYQQALTGLLPDMPPSVAALRAAAAHAHNAQSTLETELLARGSQAT
jgi:response regulator RpfG family c-di-GMP phosphodiesterase